MRIVDRAAFLALPEGTVYAKWGHAGEYPKDQDLTYQEVSVKGETLSNNWVVFDLLAWPEDCHDSGQWSDAMHAAINGTPTGALGIGESCSWDGYYDEEQLFAVFDRVEVERLVAMFQRSLETAYAPEMAEGE